MIQCKDCKHWEDGVCSKIGFGLKDDFATIWSDPEDDSTSYIELRTKPDFGCTEGKRKGE